MVSSRQAVQGGRVDVGRILRIRPEPYRLAHDGQAAIVGIDHFNGPGDPAVHVDRRCLACKPRGADPSGQRDDVADSQIRNQAGMRVDQDRCIVGVVAHAVDRQVTESGNGPLRSNGLAVREWRERPRRYVDAANGNVDVSARTRRQQRQREHRQQQDSGDLRVAWFYVHGVTSVLRCRRPFPPDVQGNTVSIPTLDRPVISL